MRDALVAAAGAMVIAFANELRARSRARTADMERRQHLAALARQHGADARESGADHRTDP